MDRGVFLGGAGVGFLAGMFFLMAIVELSGPPPNAGAKQWRDRYYTLSCSTRGLDLNLRNKDYWCQDPKTKAIYEVD